MNQPQIKCADCGKPIGETGPPDGWQMEDGRTVCQSCCVADLKRITEALIKASQDHQKERNKSGH
jgi:hypothetical protein